MHIEIRNLISEKLYPTSTIALTISKLKDYAIYTKYRLSSLVLVSALAGYCLAADQFDWSTAFYIVLGGFLVTGASNGFNQVIEKDLDKLMVRTQSRPLPTGKMSSIEGIILSTAMGAVGVFILWYFLNPLSGILGALALVSYAAIYTPMKRVSPIAVYIGAIPGAIPPMIGYVAVTGKMGLEPGILFLLQFAWQFPHFWAIAWKADEDYNKAGFKLLPSSQGKGKKSAMYILVSTIALFPIMLFPYILNITGVTSAVIITILNAWFLYLAVKLYRTVDDTVATKLMFASFYYLPIALIALVLDKV